MKHIQAGEKEEVFKLLETTGKTLLEYWPGNKNRNKDLGAETKKDGTIVTQADFAAHQAITAGLKKLFPRDVILSEEDPVHSTAKPERLWILDPVDGTYFFSVGSVQFQILLALVVDGMPVFGAAYSPSESRLTHAETGQGAYCRGKKIQVSSAPKIRNQGLYLRKSGAPHVPVNDPDPRWYKDFDDSGTGLQKVATGEFDGLFLVNLAVWDMAPYDIIIKEAGGKVSDAQGKSVLFTPQKLRHENLLFSNGKVHAELTEIAKTLE